MCGIAGILRHDLASTERVRATEAMLATLSHRGPDGRGVEDRGPACLGHARLAIIDLETGDQPHFDTRRGVVAVVNGEIYNHRELRTGLEASGHVFHTQSDTEVVPHLYAEHGETFVDHLRGMFAIALFDLEKERLLLVRDRLGQKPLYWTRSGRGVAFASELRALRTLPGVAFRASPEAVDLLLSYQYVPAPWSIVEGVYKLPPATLLVAEQGRVRARRYWDALPEQDPGLVGAALQERLGATLEEAVRLRLGSDVPLALFLSGGIDSGLVAACLPAQAVSCALNLGFAGPGSDERSLARATAEHLDLPLQADDVPWDASAVVPRVLAHLDEPLADPSCIPTWLVSRAAAARVKVVLTGDGGDEAFAGYAERYWQARVLARLRRVIPAAVRRPLCGALADLWPEGPRIPRPLRLRRVLRSLSRDLAEACFLDRSIVRPRLKQRLYRPGFLERLAGFEAAGPVRECMARTAGADPLARLLYADRHGWLAEGVLAKADRCSMAHSLELRSPLLDQELVTLASRIPTGELLQGRRGKACLRLLAAERLPARVCRAPKSGFAPPLAEWLRGPLQETVREALQAGDSWVSGVVRPDMLTRMLGEHASLRRDRSRELWTLFCLESWARAWEVERCA